MEIYTFHQEEWQKKFLNWNNFLDELKKFEGIVKIRFRLEWDASPNSSDDPRVGILRLTNLISNSLSVPWHVQDKVHPLLCYWQKKGPTMLVLFYMQFCVSRKINEY